MTNNHELSDTDLNAVSGGNPIAAFLVAYVATKILDNFSSRPSVMDSPRTSSRATGRCNTSQEIFTNSSKAEAASVGGP